MNIRSLKIAYFSPTCTTQAVLQRIALGLGVTPELFDITPPAARMSPLIANDDDLLVLGVPVYMGRVPDLLSPWLQRLALDQSSSREPKLSLRLRGTARGNLGPVRPTEWAVTALHYQGHHAAS